ncbi:glycosyltransferase [Telmatocola sphagniphila]|uniref:Glycosyltransferase n=1 Tax=Telmatocola sphagniphila TaxID=1123043 RepID=A0A8E6B601_9BACT|nr:glycosyltransferase family 4 protein [Telmatocola sphagniphila]QVL31143.1 glycosyltransferase [Telmatocola sphagniphila]
MHFLFVKENLAYPRSSGHDVHSYYLMRALTALGHEVSLATLKEVDPQAVAGGGLSSTHTLTGKGFENGTLNLSKMQEKFRGYWGIRPEIIREVGHLAKELKADVVSVVGLNVLPYLGAVDSARRVWYAGDEWFWHHTSQVRMLKSSTWGELKEGLIKGMYERVYSRLLDRVWMVSPADKKALRWVAGYRATDVLPNGIDGEYYCPADEAQTPLSTVFWGRLDFGPNIQALQWYCQNVWPRLKQARPEATFSVYGFKATAPVENLAKSTPGMILRPDLPDIRSEVRRHEVVVLPFVSGGGIKNKLLEAAALGKAIVCTPRTVKGLAAGDSVYQESHPNRFASRVMDLWAGAQLRKDLGQAARNWVLQHHTWEACAKTAVEGLK